jgi:hypothetical protein
MTQTQTAAGLYKPPTQHIQMSFTGRQMNNAPDDELMLVCEVNHKNQCKYCGMCRTKIIL